MTSYNKIIEKTALFVNETSGDIDSMEYDRLMKNFTDAFDNDLNTSLAITALYDVLKSETNSVTKTALIKEFDKVLGLDIIENAMKANQGEEIPAEVLALVEERKSARKEKNFVLADEIRNKITALGYEVRETRQGVEIRKI